MAETRPRTLCTQAGNLSRPDQAHRRACRSRPRKSPSISQSRLRRCWAANAKIGLRRIESALFIPLSRGRVRVRGVLSSPRIACPRPDRLVERTAVGRPVVGKNFRCNRYVDTDPKRILRRSNRIHGFDAGSACPQLIAKGRRCARRLPGRRPRRCEPCPAKEKSRGLLHAEWTPSPQKR